MVTGRKKRRCGNSMGGVTLGKVWCGVKKSLSAARGGASGLAKKVFRN